MREKLDFEVFNNSDAQKKKDIVRSLGIYELRGLARALGIKSPTTKIREVLIEDILLTILTGKPADPQVSRKGRPYKKLAHLDSIVSMIANKPEQSQLGFENLAAFNQEIPVFTSKSSELVKVSGVLRVGKLSTYFIDLRNGYHVFLPEEMTSQYSLQTGDYVEGEAYKINESMQFFVLSLFSINTVKAELYKPKPELESKQILPSTFLHIENMKVLKGGRNTLICKEPLFLDNAFKMLIENLERDDALNVFLGLNLCFEDNFFAMSRKNLLCFVSEYMASEQESYNRIIDAINLVSRLSSQGFNINFIIYDVGLLLATLDRKFQSEEGESNSQEAGVVLKKIISLAEAREEGTTTTLVASVKDSDVENQTIKNDLIRISAKID